MSKIDKLVEKKLTEMTTIDDLGRALPAISDTINKKRDHNAFMAGKSLIISFGNRGDADAIKLEISPNGKCYAYIGS